MSNKIYKSTLTFAMLLVATILKASEEIKIDAESAARYESDYSYYLMYAFFAATVLGFIWAAYRIFGTKENTSEESTMNKILYDAVPVDREHEVMTDHEYDGIKELDNHLPPWWVWLGYLTIIFAVVYSTYYWWTDMGLTQEQEWAQEMAYAKAQKEESAKKLQSEFDETNVKIITDAAKLAEGKDIYMKNCVACHLADGGGTIGPNLADKFFIHGSSSTDMYKIIRDGVIEKGMLSWKNQYSPYQIQNIMSYIKTEIEGRTPASPKDPQGDEAVE